MRIGVLGTGTVGMALARGLLRAGHEVMLGTRDTGSPKLAVWLGSGAGARVGSYPQAVEFAEIVITAVPGRVVADTVRGVGPAPFKGKIVIDVSNPVNATGAVPTAVYPETDSAAENIQRLLPEADVVKAFNQINPERMTDPALGSGPKTLRICGNSAAAKGVVISLAEEFGWTVEDLGDLTHARALEQGVVNWIIRHASEAR
jgi:predicted dinucleotide-binding enzyme